MKIFKFFKKVVKIIRSLSKEEIFIMVGLFVLAYIVSC